MTGLMLLRKTPIQIILTGHPTTHPATAEMLATVHSMLLPQKVMILADGNEESVLYKNLKILSNISNSGKNYLLQIVLVNTCCSKALLLGNNSKLSLCQQILVPYFVKSVHQCEYMYLIFSPILSGKVIINFHFQRNTFQDIPFPVFLWIAFKVLI